MKRIKRAQSILEYVIILTAVIVAIVAAASGFGSKVTEMINNAGAKIGSSRL